ncbi:MAG: DUF4080 domain-containing protein [Firmicutes bacterium]|nr:DUF4080 domain-containing protein [Bacillota bacterium]
MLQVVICSLNSQYIHSSLAPWYLLAGVNACCGGEVRAIVAEGTVNEDKTAVLERILRHKPQVAAFSCYIWNIARVRKLIPLLKQTNPEVTIVLGGPEVSYNAEEVLSALPAADYLIAGEGEEPFVLLLQALLHGKSPSGIPGLCYRSGKRIVKAAPHTSAKEPPDPYTDAYFSALEGRIAYLETSRGCPFSCAFCLSGRCGSIRFFSQKRVEKNLLQLAKSGAQTVKLVDRTFNANRARAREIFRFILDRYGKEIPAGVCFHFEMAGDLLDAETIDLLATAPRGAIQFEIGLQSFNPKALAAVSRTTNVTVLKDNIRKILALGNIHVHLDLIAGLPYEDLNSFQESFNTAYRLQPHLLQLGFLKILPGTPMRNNPEQFPCLYAKDPPYEVLATPWLSGEELLLLHKVEAALNRLYNSGRFRRTLHYLLQATGEAPFSLLHRFAEETAVAGTDRISLDDYTALAFNYFAAWPGVDRIVLRDTMVCDRLATNASGKLPPVLRIPDAALKKAVRKAEEAFPPAPGRRRGYALLYSEPCLVFAEYGQRDRVTGEYPLTRFPVKQ